MNIGIYIYNRAEVLDFSGPFEVFSSASLICPSGNPFNVFLVSEMGEAVTAACSYSVNPAYGFHNHPPIDVLIVAGGDHTEELEKQAVIDWIAEVGRKATLSASVCTGAFLLAEARILTTQKVITHWEDILDLQESYPDLTVCESKRWVDEGAVITSAGISAGIDMSLHLVSRLYGFELAEETARYMEYDWTDKGKGLL
ncbi:MAG: DJ-1/PfpI family protein [Desulfobacterales bacterium]|nr:DJ-1/PfpI family protein [Desulfobacterales bacterium]